jgi:hypothetical protein
MVKNQVGRPAAKTDNRAKLMTVACKLFVANDDDKVSICAISAQEHSDPGLIRYYFKSKLGLFNTMLKETSAPLLEQFSVVTSQLPHIIMQTCYRIATMDISITPEFMQHLAEQSNPLLHHGIITKKTTIKDDLNDQQ